jgi:hypothetical protein
MAWGNKKSGGNGMSCLALLVAVLALLVAWAAYKRTGGEMRTVLRDAGVQADRGLGGPVRDADTDWRAGLEHARERLLGRRSEVAGEDRNLARVQRNVAEIAEIRTNLERAYRNAGNGAKEQWRDLDANLERLQGQLKEGSSKALTTLDEVLSKIRVATNNRGEQGERGERGEKDDGR